MSLNSHSSVFAILMVLIMSAPSAMARKVDDNATSSDKIRVCLMNTDLFPLWRRPGEETRKRAGINIDLMRHLAMSLALEIQWVRAPFARCLHLTQIGEVDVMNVASYRAEREQYGHFPKTNQAVDPMRRFKFDRYLAFVKADSAITYDGDSFDNLPELPIAVEIKASIIPRLRKKGLRVIELPNVGNMFKLLEKGRVSAVVVNQFNGLKYANDNIRALQPAIVEKPYYLVISKQFYSKHPAIAEAIWQASAELQNGVYQQTMQYYTAYSSWDDIRDDH